MNDPGLDQPIAETAEEVQQDVTDQVEPLDGTGEDEAYLEPSRWWFASTAFPMIAGTFGPMASAFNICALASNWRVEVGPGESQDNGQWVKDPPWLLAVNAVSLALALVANGALLLNMARRIPFAVAQPITIVGWFLSSFLLIGLLGATHSANFQSIPQSQHPALTQAFYYAVMAAALYFLVACLMIITVYGAYTGHYSKDFKLTMSQRTLMVQTISLLAYIMVGGCIFCHVESWLFLDGVYWATVTILTIGLGDFSPKTHLGQCLIFPYAIFGIVTLGLVIGSIRSLVLERGKKKLSARMVEKKRVQIVKQMKKNQGVVKVSTLKTESFDVGDKDQSELERRRVEFEVMRLIQDHASTQRKWMALAVSGTAWFVLWFIGAVVFWIAEAPQQGLTYFEAIYFCYTSLLTIGYGDITPVANASKAFFVFWALLAIPALTIVISNMGDTVIAAIRDFSLWVSEITVLPSDEPMRERLKDAARVATKNKIFSDDDKPVEEAAGGVGLATQNRDPEKGEKAKKAREKRGNEAKKKATDRLGKEYEAVELEEYEEARQRGDTLAEDVHLHHYLLGREIRNVMRDIGSTPPKKYTYEEWKWFLQLLGEDEGDSEQHRTARGEEDLEKGGSDEFGAGGRDSRKWSWIGPRSPLLGETDEPEWVLDRLSLKLERLLRDERIKRTSERNNALKKELKHEEGRPVRDAEKAPGRAKEGEGKSTE